MFLHVLLCVVTKKLLLASSGGDEVLRLRLAADQVHAADVRILAANIEVDRFYFIFKLCLFCSKLHWPDLLNNGVEA
jgi:hypothetical protein